MEKYRNTKQLLGENVNIFHIHFEYSYIKKFTIFLPCIKDVKKKTNSQI